MPPEAPDPVPASKILPPSAPPPGSATPPPVTYRCPHCPWTHEYPITDEKGLAKIDSHLAHVHGIRAAP